MPDINDQNQSINPNPTPTPPTEPVDTVPTDNSFTEQINTLTPPPAVVEPNPTISEPPITVEPVVEPVSTPAPTPVPDQVPNPYAQPTEPASSITPPMTYSDSTPPLPPANPTGSVLPKLIIGLLLLVLLGAGLYFGVSKFSPDLLNQATPTPTVAAVVPTKVVPTVALTPTPIASATASWQTYTGTDYNFTYPSTWQKGTSAETEIVFVAPAVAGFQPNFSVSRMATKQTLDQANISISASLSKEFAQFKLLKDEKINVGTLSAIRKTFTWYDADSQTNAQQIQQYIIFDKNLFYLTATDTVTNMPATEPTFIKILDSFTFTPAIK